MALPATFPALPGPGPPGRWGYNIQRAHQLISESYHNSLHVLRREDGDALRLRYHVRRLQDRIFPLLKNLEGQDLPPAWLSTGAHILGCLIVELEIGAHGAEATEPDPTPEDQLVTLHHTGRVGRPRKVLRTSWLQEAVSNKRHITMKTIAKFLGVHRNTLRYKLRQLGLSKKYSTLSTVDLDRVLKLYKRLRPNSGLRYTMGFLRGHGIRMQRARVRASLHRIDGLGRALRQHDTIMRRTYVSRLSNGVWHIDGLHKLILWGFVLHGSADGHDHMITGLRASTNNRASTVLHLFLESIAQYGCPSRVRGDRGGENVDVAVWMIMHQGPRRGSFLWGSSTHNTRIERLWVEVATQFARRWRGFFMRLERLHGLDRHNPHHLWLLHVLFLDLLNADCDSFKEDWNYHPMSGGNRSPLDMRFLSQTRHGKVGAEYSDVHPDTLQQYYGTHGKPIRRSAHQTGAGHPLDEESDSEHEETPPASSEDEAASPASNPSLDGLERQVAKHVQANINHPPVKVPRSHRPFTDPAHEALFFTALNDICTSGAVPDGYGVKESEWDELGYPMQEHITVGRRARQMVVELPPAIWLPRAITWVQGLHTMQTLLYHLEDT